MPEGNSEPRRLHDNCAVCGVSIYWGDAVVTVSRTSERVTADGEIDIIDGDTLASLCESCGSRFPATAIRVSFGDG
jgi:hypothetical protein